MFRSAAFLALVLSHVAPHFGPRTEAARLLSELGVRYHVDPLLVIADVEHESRWRPDIINPLSGTVGLMQIDPLNLPACGATSEKWSEECWGIRTLLYAWDTNLRIGTSYFAFAHSYCVKLGRGGLAAQWLQLPTGWDAVRHSRCGYREGKRLPVPAGVRALLARRAELEKL